MPDAPSNVPDELQAVRTYQPGERPDVLVHVDEDWHRGELVEWFRDRAGRWWAHVSWRHPRGATSFDTFPADRVWEDAEPVHPANA